MEKITLALDWTPNINHIGFFVAQKKGFYKDLRLDVDLVSPATDDYTLTPAKRVEMGMADFALCPMESVLSYRTKQHSFALKAVAAVYQEDLSAIVVLKSSGITRPKELDGKSYASYQARYEDQIVKQMIINDGGSGTLEIDYPRKLGIWDTLIGGDYASTWVFMNWEGVEAGQKGIELETFRMHDFDVPYSYSPVIAGEEASMKSRKEAYRSFLKATKAGFLYAKAHPAEAAAILSPEVSEKDAAISVEAAVAYSSEALGTASTWGKMDETQVQAYLDWIYDKGLEKKRLSVSEVMTQALLF